MKRVTQLLVIALCAPTITGCVEDPPPARLDSPDRDERLEAVRQARNKYGTPAPATPAVVAPANPTLPLITLPQLTSGHAKAGDAQALVGRWQQSTDNNVEWFQFAEDGTVTDVNVRKTNKGDWRLQSGFTIKGKWRLLSADTIRFSALEYAHPAISDAASVMDLLIAAQPA